MLVKVKYRLIGKNEEEKKAFTIEEDIDLMETNDSLDSIANNDSDSSVLEVCLEISLQIFLTQYGSYYFAHIMLTNILHKKSSRFQQLANFQCRYMCEALG